MKKVYIFYIFKHNANPNPNAPTSRIPLALGRLP